MIINNLVICINTTRAKKSIKSQIEQKKCHVIDCSNNWKSKQKKLGKS